MWAIQHKTARTSEENYSEHHVRLPAVINNTWVSDSLSHRSGAVTAPNVLVTEFGHSALYCISTGTEMIDEKIPHRWWMLVNMITIHLEESCILSSFAGLNLQNWPGRCVKRTNCCSGDSFDFTYCHSFELTINSTICNLSREHRSICCYFITWSGTSSLRDLTEWNKQEISSGKVHCVCLCYCSTVLKKTVAKVEQNAKWNEFAKISHHKLLTIPDYLML